MAPVDSSAIRARRQAFRALHETGIFVMPNAWDAGSARFLQGLGFKALATTGAGSAWSMAHADGRLSRDQVLTRMKEIVDSTDLPVNADFESGFGSTPDDVAESVRLAVATGIAGLSIEDSTGEPGDPIRDVASAVARIRAARAAIDSAGGDTLLIGRAENFWVGRQDLDDTIARLQAYSAAGADVLFAAGLRTTAQIEAVVRALAPKPVSVLMAGGIATTVAQLAALGVRRVSVGSALARTAWGSFLRAARALVEEGSFAAFSDAVPFKEIDTFFRLTVDDRSAWRFAEVAGAVEYREGDGDMLRIPAGAVEIETTSSDATLSWEDGDSRGAAAIPLADFCRYVADGAIKVTDQDNRPLDPIP